MPDRYVVIGAGAIGGAVGAGLVAAGREVVFVARGAHLEAMRADGLVIETPDGENRCRARVVPDPTAVGMTDDDVVLLAVKSHDTEEALHGLAATGTRPAIVCLQNGISNESTAARYVDRVYAAMVWLPAAFLAPGRIELNAWPLFGVVEVGRFGGALDELAGEIAADLSAAGLAAEARADIMARKRGKLLVNLANAVKAMARTDADVKPLVRALRSEAESVFRAAALPFVPISELAAECTAKMSPTRAIEGRERPGNSTWQSLARGVGSTETDHLNGEIARLAIGLGRVAPRNRWVQDVVRRALADRRPPRSLAVGELEPPSSQLPETES